MPTSSQPIIHRPREAETYATSERCDILESWNRPDDPALSIARATVGVGVTTRWHHLKDTTERYLILQGHGRVHVGELQPSAVTPGDVVFIPPNCPQRIENIGDQPLVFLAVCTPRFRAECYIDLGD